LPLRIGDRSETRGDRAAINRKFGDHHDLPCAASLIALIVLDCGATFSLQLAYEWSGRDDVLLDDDVLIKDRR
jgi:hypothetical protein